MEWSSWNELILIGYLIGLIVTIYYVISAKGYTTWRNNDCLYLNGLVKAHQSEYKIKPGFVPEHNMFQMTGFADVVSAFWKIITKFKMYLKVKTFKIDTALYRDEKYVLFVNVDGWLNDHYYQFNQIVGNKNHLKATIDYRRTNLTIELKNAQNDVEENMVWSDWCSTTSVLKRLGG